MALDYPLSLPCPQTLLATPFDRAQFSDPDRPRDARALSKDRLAVIRVTWPPLSPDEAAVFQAFWKDDLLDGGAWFNATWPLPQGRVPAVFRFIEQPRWRFVPGGRWRIEAVLEQRGRTVEVSEPEPDVSVVEIGWYSPIATSPIFGSTVAHANNGTAQTSFAEGFVSDHLYAGLVGWTDETVVWSIVSWTSGDGHPSPVIADSADGWVHLNWSNTYGGELPILDASIGTLVLTATVDGTPIAIGERLIAVTTPVEFDYPSIAWGPE